MTYMENHRAVYPHVPGSKRGAPETSPDAALSVADAAKSRSAHALAFVASKGRHGATADEVATEYEWERYSSRPRLAELHTRKAIVDSGERREGASGRKQVVWVLPQFGPAQREDDQLDFLRHV